MDTRLVAVILVLGSPAFSQPRVESAFSQPRVEFSAKIGIPISEAFQTGSFEFLATGLHEGNSATRRYTAGAGLVLRLPHRFEAEVDVLYKRLGYDLTSSVRGFPVLYERTWTTANSWEFPMLGVYSPPSLLHLSLRFSAGVSFRATSGEATNGQCIPLSPEYSVFCGVTAPTHQRQDPHLSERSSFGGTFGAGVKTRVGLIRLTPEIRYTRWRTDVGYGWTPFDLRSKPNQLDFLIGIGF